jgi:hypothetical protein
MTEVCSQPPPTVSVSHALALEEFDRRQAKRGGNILVTADLSVGLRNCLTSVDRELPIFLSAAMYFSGASAVNSGVVLLGHTDFAIHFFL